MKQHSYTVIFYNSDGSINITYEDIRAIGRDAAYIVSAYQQIMNARPFQDFVISRNSDKEKEQGE